MPRTTEEILKHADELARRFEEHEPDPEQIRDARPLRDVASAFERRALAEGDLTAAVTVARAEGHTWSAIGAMLGTSGEAARQRYGNPPSTPRKGATRSRASATRSRSSSGRASAGIRQFMVRRDDDVAGQENASMPDSLPKSV